MTGQGVALTGLGVLTPGVGDPEEFARALRAGHSTIGHDGVAGAGSFLRDFQPRKWAEARLSEADAAAVARIAARTALPAATACCVAAQALTDAGLDPGRRERTALVVAGNNLALGYQAATTLAHDREPRSVRPSHALTCLDTDTVGAVSEVTGVRSEGWTIGAASASGTLALIAGARLLHAGEADHCLVVAPAAELSAVEIDALRLAGALARPDGTDEAGLCRPFDERRRGFVAGQAAAAVVLERTGDARRRGAPVLAHLAGYGQRLDGHRGAEPDPRGQALAMSSALRRADLAPEEIDYVNAHGTGSRVGDAAEAAAVRAVFGERRSSFLNSTKALVGHCLSATGLVEVVATVLQLRDGFVHANPNLRHPIDPGIGLVDRTAEAAPLRAAMSNSFAFGGVNTSVVLLRGDPPNRG
jgi:malonyl-ACP decarboxylase